MFLTLSYCLRFSYHPYDSFRRKKKSINANISKMLFEFLSTLWIATERCTVTVACDKHEWRFKKTPTVIYCLIDPVYNAFIPCKKDFSFFKLVCSPLMAPFSNWHRPATVFGACRWLSVWRVKQRRPAGERSPRARGDKSFSSGEIAGCARLASVCPSEYLWLYSS